MGYKDSILYQDLTPTLTAVALFSSLGAFSFGYDNNWWGGVIGAAWFGNQFGSGTKTVDNQVVHVLSASDKSTGTALGTVGIILGCTIAPFINERFGRRRAFVALVNCYTVVQNFGTFLGNAVMFGVHAKTNAAVWLVPIGVQFIFPIIIVAGSMFLPESPRWLIAQGQEDEAYKVLRRLRGAEAREESIRAEVEEIAAAYDDQLRNKSTSWAQLFRGTDLRRTLIAVGMQCLQQGQGISFMNNYLNTTMLALGYANTYELLVVLYACKVIISFLGFYLPDRIGRRPLVLGGSSVMLACMTIVGACSAVTNNKPTGALGRLTIGAIFTWILVYAFTWSPMPWTIASEVPTNSLRGKTLATAAWGGFVVGLISNLVVPYIQDADKGNLGGRISFVFAGFSAFALVFCGFFVPEFKGRSLEEIDILFENKIPAYKFASYGISPLLAPVVNAEKGHKGATERKIEDVEERA